MPDELPPSLPETPPVQIPVPLQLAHGKHGNIPAADCRAHEAALRIINPEDDELPPVTPFLIRQTARQNVTTNQ